VAVKERPMPQECAVGVLVSLIQDKEAEKIARKIAETIDYCGIGEIELLYSYDDNQYYVVEFNARPWIQYGLMVSSGHDCLKYLLTPEKYRVSDEKKQGFTWLNLGDDLYYCFSRTVGYVRKREISLTNYLISLLKTNVHSIFDWRDIKPFWISIRRFLRTLLFYKT
jgi:predicted ATP-grasp superfamily ATP-dependent carboligase